MEMKQYQDHFCGAILVLLIIITICQLVLVARPSKVSGFQDTYKSSLPFLASRSDLASGFVGQGEAPAFWNLGSVKDVNDALQAAATQSETTSQPPAAKGTSGFTGAPKAAESKLSSYTDLNEGFSTKLSKIAQMEKFAGTGL